MNALTNSAAVMAYEEVEEDVFRATESPSSTSPHWPSADRHYRDDLVYSQFTTMQGVVFTATGLGGHLAAFQSLEIVDELESGRWVGEVELRIRAVEHLRANWDSYGSPPVTSEAAQTARQIMHAIKFSTPPIPFIAPLSGGGIQFEWVGGDKELDIVIDPRGDSVSYALYDGDDDLEGQVNLCNEDELRQLIGNLSAKI